MKYYFPIEKIEGSHCECDISVNGQTFRMFFLYRSVGSSFWINTTCPIKNIMVMFHTPILAPLEKEIGSFLEELGFKSAPNNLRNFV